MRRKMIALAVVVALASPGVQALTNPFKRESSTSATGDALAAAGTEVAACKTHKELQRRPRKEIGGIPIPSSLPGFGVKVPPLCVVETPLGLLVITAEMLDEATINASQALEMAQNQLLPESKRIRLGVAQMLETRDGLHPTAAVSAQRTETSNALGTSADQVTAALEEMKAHGAPLTPELRDTLMTVSALLTKATYYQVETLVGARMVKEATDDTGSRNLLKGAGLDFALKLPGRTASLLTNFPKLGTVQNAITAVSDKSMVRELEKAKKSAAEEGEANAREQAMSSDAAARTVNF
jgi:hypothetical protein